MHKIKLITFHAQVPSSVLVPVANQAAWGRNSGFTTEKIFIAARAGGHSGPVDAVCIIFAAFREETSGL